MRSILLRIFLLYTFILHLLPKKLRRFLPRSWFPAPAPALGPSLSSQSNTNTTRSTMDQAELDRVFQMFDHNGDGRISKKELNDSLENLGIYIPDVELTQMIERIDVNGDGCVDIDEFGALYKSIMEEKDEERIISKGISVGNSRNCYRGLVQVQSKAENARNSSQCDSMLLGDTGAANTYPYIQVKNPTARVEHEASTSKIGEDQLFYFQQRGIDYEKAMAAMISGFCRDVFNELPDEFGAEVNQLMSLKLEGSVG